MFLELIIMYVLQNIFCQISRFRTKLQNYQTCIQIILSKTTKEHKMLMITTWKIRVMIVTMNLLDKSIAYMRARYDGLNEVCL